MSYLFILFCKVHHNHYEVEIISWIGPQLMERLSIKRKWITLYVLLLQFKSIFFSFRSSNLNAIIWNSIVHIPIGAIISLKWMTLTFIQLLLLIYLHFISIHTLIHTLTYTQTECVDKVRYLPYGKSFTS